MVPHGSANECTASARASGGAQIISRRVPPPPVPLARPKEMNDDDEPAPSGAAYASFVHGRAGRGKRVGGLGAAPTGRQIIG